MFVEFVGKTSYQNRHVEIFHRTLIFMITFRTRQQLPSFNSCWRTQIITDFQLLCQGRKYFTQITFPFKHKIICDIQRIPVSCWICVETGLTTGIWECKVETGVFARQFPVCVHPTYSSGGQWASAPQTEENCWSCSHHHHRPGRLHHFPATVYTFIWILIRPLWRRLLICSAS